MHPLFDRIPSAFIGIPVSVSEALNGLTGKRIRKRPCSTIRAPHQGSAIVFQSIDKIRIKPIHPVYSAGSRRIRIGAQADITVEIEDDEDSKFKALFELLDGSRDVAGVVAEMRSRFPGVTADDVHDVIAGLDKERLLERAMSTDYDDPQHPRHRYLSNVNYFSNYGDSASLRGEFQDRLLQSKVLVLGLGAGGSHIVSHLASMGVAKIRAVDYDRVELTNLNRQILYGEGDVGSLKTEAGLRRIAEYNSTLDLEFIARKVVSQDDIRDLCDGMDLIVCAIDEPPFVAQLIVNAVAVERGIPCVFGMSQITAGRFFTVLPGQSGCMGCLVVHYSLNDPAFSDQFIAFQELEFKNPTLSFSPDVARLCGMIASEVARVLTGFLPPMGVGRQVELNFEDNSTKALTEWQRHPEACPVCGCGVRERWPIFRYLDARQARAARAACA